MRHVDERRASSLREDRRRLACIAEVDRTNIEGFQHLRTSGEFSPRYLEAQSLQLVFKRALTLQKHEFAVLLETDANDFIVGMRGRRRRHYRQSSRSHREKRVAHCAHLAWSLYYNFDIFKNLAAIFSLPRP